MNEADHVPLSADRLPEIERRLAEATPGPWTQFGEGDFWAGIQSVECRDRSRNDPYPDVMYAGGIDDCGYISENDATFIANAPTDIADLLADNRRLRAALNDLVDDEPCRYDHHGYCQEHGVSKPCVMAAARAALGLEPLT